MWVVAARVVPRAMQSLLQQRAHGFYTVDVDIAWPYVLARGRMFSVPVAGADL